MCSQTRKLTAICKPMLLWYLPLVKVRHGSPIAGQANVLVFPSLEAGNIAYKLVHASGCSRGYRSHSAGMAAPVNDLSRGCSVDDIYKMIVITCNQSLGIKAN
jgi:phosphate acetyltransferase